MAVTKRQEEENGQIRKWQENYSSLEINHGGLRSLLGLL